MRLTESLYQAGRAYLGDERGEALPDAYELAGRCADRLPEPPSCVYVAADDDDRPLYVGSIHRASPGGLRALREHLRDPRKTATWRRVWILPIRAGTSRSRVRALEGRVGARLAPVQQRRLPRY